MHFKNTLSLCLGFLLLAAGCTAQKNAKAAGKAAESVSRYRFAFYNVENLFDTLDDPDKDDAEFLPEGKNKWTNDRYEKKLSDISRVFETMGYPDVIGMAEIENDHVLDDLTAQKDMKKQGYAYVHYESPDVRGIDVALLYKGGVLKVLSSEAIGISFPAEYRTRDGQQELTRDILHVKALAGADTLHFYVNHWPSRRAGAESELRRNFVARQLRQSVDRLWKSNPAANIVIMGDLNDEPADKSVSHTLSAAAPSQWTATSTQGLYDLCVPAKQQGLGSYNHVGNWNMLDHIIVSGSLLDSRNSLRADTMATIFRESWMEYNDRKYGPVPSRTYTGPVYRGGYSDHFPVYVNLVGMRPQPASRR